MMRQKRDIDAATNTIKQAIDLLEMPYPFAPRLVRGRATRALDLCRTALQQLDPTTSTEDDENG